MAFRRENFGGYKKELRLEEGYTRRVRTKGDLSLRSLANMASSTTGRKLKVRKVRRKVTGGGGIANHPFTDKERESEKNSSGECGSGGSNIENFKARIPIWGHSAKTRNAERGD